MLKEGSVIDLTEFTSYQVDMWLDDIRLELQFNDGNKLYLMRREGYYFDGLLEAVRDHNSLEFKIPPKPLTVEQEARKYADDSRMLTLELVEKAFLAGHKLAKGE